MNNQEETILCLYQELGWSTYEIADSMKTYPNKIRRILNKHGVSLRDSSAAQKNALKKGRAEHPTQGKKISQETKEKISESQGEVWDSMTTKEKSYRSQIGKRAWDKKSDEEKSRLIEQAQNAVRETSRIGSKLEHFLLSELGKRKVRVEFHKEHWLQNQNLQVDLYLPEYRAAVEVDGPSHFKPVWGQENLDKNIKADQQKTGLILGSGLVMIRIKQTQSLTQRYMRNTLQRLLDVLSKIKDEYPEEHERYFEL